MQFPSTMACSLKPVPPRLPKLRRMPGRMRIETAEEEPTDYGDRGTVRVPVALVSRTAPPLSGWPEQAAMV